jgi:acetolactate decarboxylase
MSVLWQNMPSAAFKKGLYAPYLTVRESRERGGFGVGEYEFLDGEVTALNGEYYRQVAEGKLLPLDDDERLCFSSVTHFAPTNTDDLASGLTETTIQPVFLKAFETPNAIFAMRIDGVFDQVATTAVPRQSEPFASFDKVPHVPFQFKALPGTLVCFYLPGFVAETGIAGFHFHFLSEDRTGGGHVTSFTLRKGVARWNRVSQFALQIPCGSDFDNATLT